MENDAQPAQGETHTQKKTRTHYATVQAVVTDEELEKIKKHSSELGFSSTSQFARVAIFEKMKKKQ